VAARVFLKIEGIKGESTDAKHAGEIDVEAFSWGVTQSGSASGGGGSGAGKASFSDFSFVTRSTTASPQLMLACATGKHLKEAVLTARRSGASPVEFLKITFTDLLISSYQESGGDDVPGDSVSFDFAKIKFEFTAAGAKGTAGARVSAGWDQKASKKF
jgi:type VI secretion system secreted protein Hcp